MQKQDLSARNERKPEADDTLPDHNATDEAPKGEERSESDAPTEIGGRDGPDPTRYGDWEKNGRCIDF